MAEEINQQIEHLVSGTPRQRYQAEKNLKQAGNGALPEDNLVTLLDQAIADDARIAILSVLEKHISRKNTATIVRHLGLRNHRVRRAAASVLLHASPRLKPFHGQLQKLLERETDQATRQVLEKLVARS